MPPATAEILEWLRFAATIATPFAVMGLGFWISARAASRKALMEQIDKKIEAMAKQIADGNEECRSDIRAIVVQVSAFQREVAERYPLRQQVETALAALRDDMRFYLTNRGQSPDDPRRRR